MKIGIICNYPIPYGMAATTRIFSYAKGLSIEKCNVEVISWLPSDKEDNLQLGNEGYIDQVKYIYAYKRCKSHNKFKRVVEGIYSLFCLASKLRKNNQKQKYDFLIISSDHIPILTYIAFINLILRAKLVFIFDEFPTPIRRKLKKNIPSWKRMCYKLILPFYSGYISMTENLLSFYQNIYNNKGVIVSSITDISRFEKFNTQLEKTDKKFFNLTYMGNMELSKDNVDNIIEAIALLKDKYEFILNLYGKPSLKDKNKLINLIAKYKLENLVKFNFASFNEIPEILSKADILLSSQPNTVRAAGGFPTKLGEYLATGKPVLLTNVGEIGNLFYDKQELYLAEPNNPSAYAKQLSYIFDHYDEAIEVGKRGKNKIIKNYSHIHAGKTIINFLNKL